MLKPPTCSVITAGLCFLLGTSTSFQAPADTTPALHDNDDNSNLNHHVCGHECYETAVVEAVSKGHFSQSRWLAEQALHAGCGNPQRLAELYQQHANDWLDRNNNACFTQPDAPRQHHVQSSPMDEPDCWSFDVIENTGEDPLELWDECCSQVSSVLDQAAQHSCDVFFLSQSHSSSHQNPSDIASAPNLPTTCRRGQQHQHMCCDFRQGTSSYLRLPVLRELAIRLAIQNDDGDDGSTGAVEIFDIEQDGFLRMYDTSIVLWPAAYLLTLCVAAPTRCGVPELYKSIESGPTVELGAGIGIPSIALSYIHKQRLSSSAASVFATDVSRRGLMLTATNALAANTSVIPVLLNHSNITAVTEFRNQYAPHGFSIVLGSALQDLFHESTREKDDKLWNVLDVLLAEDDDVDDGHHASIVLLSHTIHALQLPLDGRFERIRIISGDVFGMKTRWSSSSDFEISVLRRRRQRQEQQSAPPTAIYQDEL